MEEKEKRDGTRKDEKKKTVREENEEEKRERGQEEEKRKRVTEGTKEPGKKQRFEPDGSQTNLSFLVLDIKR
jgi:hypothetical protein